MKRDPAIDAVVDACRLRLTHAAIDAMNVEMAAMKAEGHIDQLVTIAAVEAGANVLGSVLFMHPDVMERRRLARTHTDNIRRNVAMASLPPRAGRTVQ